MCCCGCGSEITTPLSPTGWRLIFDGRTVSLEPSVGNWSYPCRAHYWIRRGRVEWAPRWSDEEIAEGRNMARRAKEAYYAGADGESHRTAPEDGGGIGDRQHWAGLLHRLGIRLLRALRIRGA